MALYSIDQTKSKLGLGCWAIGAKGWGPQDDGDSRLLLRHAVQEGVFHWDTAQAYGGGHSEKLCGEYLREYRQQIFIASKSMMRSQPGSLTQSLDASRERLGVDCIDLFYLHWPKREFDIARHLEELEAARDQGKIRYIGVSNFSVEDLELAGKSATIDAHQINYSLLWREPDKDMLSYCQENNISVVTYSSIAQGILCGKFPEKPQFSTGDSRGYNYFFREDIWPKVYEAVDKMKQISRECQRPMLDLAIHWVAVNPMIHTVLVGARNKAQFGEQIKAFAEPIPHGVLNQLTRISDDLIAELPPYPPHLFGAK